MKKPIKVFCLDDLTENWQDFQDGESPKISDGSTEAVAIFCPNGPDIDLYLIDADKICRTSFSESGRSQSEAPDLGGKLLSIFEMMNGKKFGTPKVPLFMQKALAATQSP